MLVPWFVCRRSMTSKRWSLSVVSPFSLMPAVRANQTMAIWFGATSMSTNALSARIESGSLVADSIELDVSVTSTTSASRRCGMQGTIVGVGVGVGVSVGVGVGVAVSVGVGVMVGTGVGVGGSLYAGTSACHAEFAAAQDFSGGGIGIGSIILSGFMLMPKS